MKTERKPITRPYPDARTPEGLDFQEAAGDMIGGAKLKRAYMEGVLKDRRSRNELMATIEGSPYYMRFLKSVHPRYDQYSGKQKFMACVALARSHPRLLAEKGQKRNEMHGVPNRATSSRFMDPFEQHFLTKAMRLIKEDVEKHPFHIHGETGVVGNRICQITSFGHNPKSSVSLRIGRGDKYALHSHPPFSEPYTSSASETDHREAAESYLFFKNKTNEYVTNGKDVLHIHPASMELVKLIPLPRVEERMGKFPEAFKVPDAKEPPRPFANHEAPAAFRENWQAPAGWKPPEDYPRARSAE